LCVDNGEIELSRVRKTLLRVEYGTESSQSRFDRVCCVNSVVVCRGLSQVLVESETETGTGGAPKQQLRIMLLLSVVYVKNLSLSYSTKLSFLSLIYLLIGSSLLLNFL